ncbi:MAG: Fe2+-dependent dioxygenase [Alphaproteobacteria bacterium]|nr:Fe2+-dependent dioxygenase [Alphaproteobacteria bacterium]
MLICIPEVLSKAAVADIRKRIDTASWVDGRVTAGAQSAVAKKNAQLPEGSPVARAAGEAVLDALAGSTLFLSAALPLKIFPPLFNRYGEGDGFGVHVDNAIRAVPGHPVRVRTDLSATLFLSEPEDYDGGELAIETAFGAQEVKLAAGDLVLYPASSLHRVNPIKRGVRTASFFWLQSMVRDDGERALLFDLDQTIQALAAERGQADPKVVSLTGLYHNLMRRWADA